MTPQNCVDYLFDIRLAETGERFQVFSHYVLYRPRSGPVEGTPTLRTREGDHVFPEADGTYTVSFPEDDQSAVAVRVN